MSIHLVRGYGQSASADYAESMCGQARCEAPASDAFASDVRLCVSHWQTAIRDFNLATETLQAQQHVREIVVAGLIPEGMERVSGLCPGCQHNDTLYMAEDGVTVRCATELCGFSGHEAVCRDSWHEFLLHRAGRRAVVYYIRFGEYIKIGFSKNLRRRVQALPCDELCAFEFGSRDLEATRHGLFAESRHVGEWFRPTAKLEKHIEYLRSVLEGDAQAA